MMYKLPRAATFLMTILACSLFIYNASCKKISDADPVIPPTTDTTKTDSTHHLPADLSTKVTSSISGFVINIQAANEPMQGVNIAFGGKTAITDEFGYFKIEDAIVIKEAAMLSASAAGYYTNYKTFITSEGKSLFTRIKMEYVTNSGMFNSAAGGTAENGSGGKITFPPDAFILEGSMTPYNGMVTAHFRIIDESNDNLSYVMPGDGRGLDSSNRLKLLTTYGAGQCIITGEKGERLQLATGSKATISMPLYSNYQPDTTALWYFDKAIGLWRQQGLAIKSGFNYEGNISNIEELNFASSLPALHVTARLVNSTGEPVPFTHVDIATMNVVQQHRPVWTFSDADGYLDVAAPANTKLSFDVSGGCADPVFSKRFETTGTDINLGEMALPEHSVITIDTRLIGCDNTPVADGFVIMGATDFFRFESNDSGAVHINTVPCLLNTEYRYVFIPYDRATKQKGDLVSEAFVPRHNDLPALSVCGKYNLVKADFTLADQAGNPVPDLFVRIAPVTSPSAPFRAISSATGKINLSIYMNTDYKLSIYGSLNCGTSILTTSFSTINRDTSLGTITLTNIPTANVKGMVLDCDNNPVTSGVIVMYKDGISRQYPINSSGAFDFKVAVCNNSSGQDVTLTAGSIASLQSGKPVKINIAAGDNSIGNLTTCPGNTSTLQFVNYVIDDSSFYSYVSPPDDILYSSDPTKSWVYISASKRDVHGTTTFTLPAKSLAAGAQLPVDGIVLAQYKEGPWQRPFYANIESYGPIGGFIEGTISGKFYETTSTSPLHNFSCRFRIKRTQ